MVRPFFTGSLISVFLTFEIAPSLSGACTAVTQRHTPRSGRDATTYFEKFPLLSVPISAAQFN